MRPDNPTFLRGRDAAYMLFVLVMIGALRYMTAGVELEPSTNDTSPIAPVAPTGTEPKSTAE